MFISFINF